ncbi:mechanosensitive ion channel family protein [Ornithinibacillus bavariensis]|uniref:Mechanosensing system component YbdG n=1 Tax=Ornithinibacillus bavariensis TaxID=545502 RepID=A0A920C5F6_9BACI|nr:mechanosensitive ion channel family protein [Ornithinibacillus bavariensis]GIO25468.1 membrane protein [Ornithinibacillus bavariensis]
MDFINNWISGYDINPPLDKYLSVTLTIIFVTVVCVIANFITKQIVIRIITRILKRHNYKWGNILLERKVFRKLSHIVPAIIIFRFAVTYPSYQDLIEKAAITYVIIVSLSVINSLLNVINDIYQTYEISKSRPIKGYIQVAKIVILTFGVILVIATLIGESPLILLSGFGALSAVFMLVFKDSILGLVAGVQLSSNDMVRVGDWIEMPKYGADGDIIDISLNTVKVQNWDKTITTIPSYALISDSFKNWRGMQTSGGRRIKRALFFDTTSIQFCSEEMIERFKHIQLLTDYINERGKEIEAFNKRMHINRENPVNGRALTNIGVFRAYVTNYLKHHSGINQDMTLMVRQLAPTENGIPLEVYAFTNDVNWSFYESVQSDIFDHLFAVAPEFGLRIFQNPTGNDLKGVVERITHKNELRKQED